MASPSGVSKEANGMSEASTALADVVEPPRSVAVPRRPVGDDPGPGVSSVFRVALLIPMCGTAGIWGPSCIASAQVAAHELNRGNGIAGRNIELVLIDSAIEAPTPVEVVVRSLIDSRSIDAIVGMHISAVRQRLTKVVAGRIPYVYTPLYEGGEHGFGVFAIGDTPPKQLGPAMQRLHRDYKLRKWALIGNDYVWPRTSHRYARRTLAEMGAAPVYERYVPFESRDMPEQVERLAASGADAVLISLVGQEAVDFNRIFGAMGLDRTMIRLPCAIEENGLLASGEGNLKRLFCSSSYFGVLPTAENACFRESYYAFHGDRAPVLNALGQSTYEGLQFLASLMRDGRGDWRERGTSTAEPVAYRSARQAVYISNTNHLTPVYLARADGLVFRIVTQIY